MRRVLFPLLLLVPVLLVAAVGCSDSGGPLEGYWVGDRLTFQVRDGRVIEPGTSKISCNGEDGCFAEGNRFFEDASFDIVDGAFGGSVEPPLGTVVLTGAFSTSTYAVGTYKFEAADGCCTVSGTWRAEFFKPYDEPDTGVDTGHEDVTGQPDDQETEPPPDGLYPPSATPEQITAVNYVNQIRSVLGLPFITEIEEINKAAQAHAAYFELHCSEYLNSQLSPHQESQAWPEGFTGVNHPDRMAHFGFSGYAGWEVMAFIGDPKGAVDGWMETLYHRLPFVNPATFELGYGMVKGGCYQWSTGTDVMDFSTTGKITVEEPIAWPYDGQTGVSPSWMGYESPQPPLDKGQTYPSGPVITLTFPGSSPFKVSSHELLDSQGKSIPHQWVDPSNDPAKFLQDTVSLYAYDPLQANSLYTVTIKGTWKSEDREWTWKFTTGTAPPTW
ncbi:MAG: CAP domain-containing protein [Deltaproteobacteria bacterium]|nr:CAP domain-containing protein [Deltaproteobacteria bacterium]